jgi:ATP-dependent Lhr-like helicase
MLRRGLVTNDRFDIIRKGEKAYTLEPTASESLSRRPTLRRSLRRSQASTDGRWSLIAWGIPDTETRAVHQAYALLDRYGIVAREMALLDPWLLPWRVLYEIFSRLELTGEVRRGYFVEGLSGAQFALPEAARQLADFRHPNPASEPIVLLHSLDPANLYGATAPLCTARENGSSRLTRRSGNWLVLRAGQPLLWIEHQGKRLTPMSGAGRDDLLQAVGRLRDLLRTPSGSAGRGKISVHEWDDQPVTSSPGRTLLEEAGFVHDFPAMTLYASA